MASGLSTIILLENRNELCNRLKILQQEKQAGINFDIFDKEIVAIVHNLFEYKCMSTKQHKFLPHKCLNYMRNMKLILAFQNVNIYDILHLK